MAEKFGKICSSCQSKGGFRRKFFKDKEERQSLPLDPVQLQDQHRPMTEGAGKKRDVNFPASQQGHLKPNTEFNAQFEAVIK